MPTQTVGVECTFSANSTIQVRRIQQGEQWITVEQGRQWQDGNGRHLLIMLPNQQTRTLTLRPDTLLWELQPLPNTRQVV